jgi:hypothetical protein
MVREEFPWVRLIESGGNIGYSRGNNLGLRHATGDWLYLLNPDTVVLPGSLRKLLDFATAHPEAGAMAPLQYDGGGNVQYEAAVELPTIWNVLCDFTLLSAFFPRSAWLNGRKLGHWNHEDDRQVPAIAGSAMLVSRAVWERVGGLDETMFCVEDMDYCKRIKEAGWQIWYTASSRIIHYGRSSIVQQSAGWQRQVMLQSWWVYRRKHFGRAAGWSLSVFMFLWSAAAWTGLALPALLLSADSSIGNRVRQIREMAASLLAWSLCNKMQFRHPLAAPVTGGQP